jgi:HSP20 family protein
MFSGYGDPFARLQDELERMLSTVEDAFGGVYPPLNVFDAGEEVILKAELPGVDPSKLEVEVRDNTVTVSGERSADTPEKNAAFHRRERVDGRFRRVSRLPARLQGDEAKAEYKHGVLTVRIPKTKEVRPRRVEVAAA